jgi:hypothetical protein
MGPRAAIFGAVALFLCLGCQGLDRFDTTHGAAYCGQIVDAEFIRSTGPGGFGRMNLCLELDTSKLDSTPGNITTDDATDGPCAPKATFDHALLDVPTELVSDAMSSMEFGDGQIQNLVTWTSSTCRGPALAIVSLYRNDRVEVRLMKPPGTDPTAPGAAEGFGLFQLERSAHGF